MLYRPFGRAGTPVSLLGFGGMRFGDIENREKSVNVMLEAARAGVTYFDTRSEETFGDAFREMRRLAWYWNIGLEEAAKCTACGQCEEACTQHLPIIKRTEEIAAMKPPVKG
jgi:predicted aldo/keto reductase-like oxidoreductase